MNLFAGFASVFRAARDAPALICPDGENWSYGRLLAAAERTAGALRGLGVAEGDRVLAQVAKSPEAVALYLACLKAGAIYAPISPALADAEVDYLLSDLAPSLFVRETPFPAAVKVATLDAQGGGSLSAAVAAATPLTATVAASDADVAAIIYTSGTTGRPKGAMLTHGNLASNARALRACWGWRDDDVLLHALPIAHVHGLFVALHCAFLSGTPTIFLPKFDAAQVRRLLPDATVMMGVPTHYARLLNEPGFQASTCRNIRLFVSGSAPLAVPAFKAFEERTGLRVLERYGMSETLMNTSNPLDGERVPGTVGFALPGVEVRIADAAGKAVANGEVGGIEVRGPNVCKGYWRRPEKTRENFRADGFFVTGDLGAMDDEGRVAIVGREKDLVISGGNNVYPKEVENLLDQMPEVVESAVFGVPHPDFGEAVVAAVVSRGALDQRHVDAFLNGRIARYKQPKRVVRMDALPRNAMGKVLRNALRDIHGALFAKPLADASGAS